MALLGVLSGVLEFLAMTFLIALAAGQARSGWALPGWLAGGRGPLAAAALLVAAGSAAVTVLAARVTTGVGAAALTAIRGRLTRAYLDADWPAQRAEPTGRLQELATSDAGQVAVGAQHAADAVAGSLRLATFAAAALLVSPLATGALLVVVGVVGGCARFGGRHTRTASRRATEAGSRLGLALTETTLVVADLRVFGVRDAQAAALAERAELAGRLHRETMFQATVTPRLTRDLAVLALTVVLLVVLWLGDLALPTLGLVILLAMRCLAQASALGATVHLIRERLAYVDRVEERLASWTPSRAPGRRAYPQGGAARLALTGVEVRHRDDLPGRGRPALAGLDLALRPGERLGVVGRSGAGKSTLARLLLGLLEPSAGKILIDGVDRAEIDSDDWFGRVATVGQDPTMISGTIADNVRFLRAGISDAAVLAAARAAGLGPELASWPDGIHHATGRHGAALSGGQRQRVALARALVRPVDLLVLDEPSSALDAAAEQALLTAVARADPATTVVIIAHRMSTVLDCDRIAVLEHGRLVALASPADLAGTVGYFRDALLQASVYTPKEAQRVL
ncbi:ATP-binding cassette domain-containing protein [Pseudofrankia asymbiotica]|uniref:ABC transporter n=1 Tax=Pseudofrankia asymbiotica TaxID=1834516 RepID=A0A1V2I2G5_9ACTN|nr:ABC transporter ATP-binding protein [Pseudofrankia asymbiotica]ONH24008.1 ABC transporter [Pseudofrankia asymbiotica]